MDLSPYALIQIAFFIGTFALSIVLGYLFRPLVQIPSDGKSRLSHLDGLRALSAIAVVACHTNQHLLSFFGFTEIPAIGNRIGSIGVYMFFGLTSYLFTERALKGGLDSAQFYIGRVKRIVPLNMFVAACTVVLGIYMASTPIQGIQALLIQIVDIFTYGFMGSLSGPPLMILDFNAARLIGIGWTLAFEWKFYLVFPVLFFLAKSSKKLGLLLATILVIVAARDFVVLTEVVWPFFLTGALVAYIKHTIRPLPEHIKKLLTLLTLPIFFTALMTSGNWIPIHLFLAIALFLCVALGEPEILKGNTLKVIGTVSYSFYLLQYLVLAPVVQSAWMLGVGNAPAILKFLTAFAVPALLVPISCLSYRYIESPWMKKKSLPPQTTTAPHSFEKSPSSAKQLETTGR